MVFDVIEIILASAHGVRPLSRSVALPALEMLRVNGLRQTLQAFALRLSLADIGVETAHRLLVVKIENAAPARAEKQILALRGIGDGP